MLKNSSTVKRLPIAALLTAALLAGSLMASPQASAGTVSGTIPTSGTTSATTPTDLPATSIKVDWQITPRVTHQEPVYYQPPQVRQYSTTTTKVANRTMLPNWPDVYGVFAGFPAHPGWASSHPSLIRYGAYNTYEKYYYSPYNDGSYEYWKYTLDSRPPSSFCPWLNTTHMLGTFGPYPYYYPDTSFCGDPGYPLYTMWIQLNQTYPSHYCDETVRWNLTPAPPPLPSGVWVECLRMNTYKEVYSYVWVWPPKQISHYVTVVDQEQIDRFTVSCQAGSPPAARGVSGTPKATTNPRVGNFTLTVSGDVITLRTGTVVQYTGSVASLCTPQSSVVLSPT